MSFRDPPGCRYCRDPDAHPVLHDCRGLWTIKARSAAGWAPFVSSNPLTAELHHYQLTGLLSGALIGVVPDPVATARRLVRLWGRVGVARGLTLRPWLHGVVTSWTYFPQNVPDAYDYFGLRVIAGHVLRERLEERYDLVWSAGGEDALRASLQPVWEAWCEGPEGQAAARTRRCDVLPPPGLPAPRRVTVPSGRGTQRPAR